MLSESWMLLKVAPLDWQHRLILNRCCLRSYCSSAGISGAIGLHTSKDHKCCKWWLWSRIAGFSYRNWTARCNDQLCRACDVNSDYFSPTSARLNYSLVWRGRVRILPRLRCLMVSCSWLISVWIIIIPSSLCGREYWCSKVPNQRPFDNHKPKRVRHVTSIVNDAWWLCFQIHTVRDIPFA